MDNQQLWQAILGELELTLSKANFTTWFTNTAISNVENGKAIVIVPNTFTQTWLQNKYHNEILKAFSKVTNDQIKEILYKVENLKNPTPKPTSSISSAPTDQGETPSPLSNVPKRPMPPQPSRPRESQQMSNEFQINPKYSFENFVVGKSNELAHAACCAVAQRPGTTYNPLFLYGGVGLGKTHLMQAIGHVIRQKNPNAKILYASCEKFTNDYINMVKTGRGKQFQDTYRSVDLLLIDDIQFITGKEGTQEAFFHTFNSLHQQNKQVVITSDRPPKAISALEVRLLSRFEWGMIADIQNPDLETRIAILEKKCKEKAFPLPTEIINHIAANIQSNIRELEGALNRVIAHHHLQRLEPSLETVKPLLSSITSTFPKKSLTPKKLVNTVCEFYGISEESILGNSRKKDLVTPRQIAMYIMREELQSSYPSIGAELGGRDHTTAMHACEKIRKEVENNERVRQEINLIKQRLYNS